MTIMDFKRFMLAALCCTVLLPGCKDDDDNTVDYKYFSGSIAVSDKIPPYVAPGDEFTFVRSEIVNLVRSADDDSGTEIGYYVTNPYLSTSDTLDLDWETYTFRVEDNLGTFSISIKGFLPGYIASGGTAEFTVVDPEFTGRTLTGTGIEAGDPSFTDPRDNRKYWYNTQGGLVWMRNNLAYEGSGISYRNSPAMDALAGRFYTREEAVTACPQGWRLPTDEEFESMAGLYGGNSGDLMVYAEFNGSRMWEHWSSVSVTNASGLSFIPMGYATRTPDSFAFAGVNDYAAFWTSSTEDGMGVYRYIYSDKATVYRGLQSSTDFALPVRCVKADN